MRCTRVGGCLCVSCNGILTSGSNADWWWSILVSLLQGVNHNWSSGYPSGFMEFDHMLSMGLGSKGFLINGSELQLF